MERIFETILGGERKFVTLKDLTAYSKAVGIIEGVDEKLSRPRYYHGKFEIPMPSFQEMLGAGETFVRSITASQFKMIQLQLRKKHKAADIVEFISSRSCDSRANREQFWMENERPCPRRYREQIGGEAVNGPHFRALR